MKTKQALKVIGTILFLFGVFGYIFPHWKVAEFTNNENLFHVISGLILVLMANFSARQRQTTIIIATLLYLGLGIYGFSLGKSGELKLKRVEVKLDEVDNYSHIAFGLAFGWYWLVRQKTL